MKILITGGTGLIGSAFIHQFNSHQFTVLSRSLSKASTILPSSIQLIDSLQHLDNLDDFDAVINLAGEPIIDKRWSAKQKKNICQSRWQITQDLVTLFARSQHPPHTFLSGSAIGIYGDRADQPLNEHASLQQSDFPSKVSLRWEMIAKQAKPYTRVVLLRTGIVLSLHAGALAKMLFPFKCYLGGRIGSGNQYLSWIHIQDQINAIHFLLTEKEISGAVNIVAPDPQRNKHFTQTLATVLHRIAVFTIPKKALQYLLGESSCLLLDSQKVIPEKLLNSGFVFTFNNLQAALLDLLKDNSDKELN